MKRFKHPLHGFHHPFSAAEEATMRQNGWVEEVEEPKAVKAAEVPAEVLAEAPAEATEDIASVRAKLEAAGIEYDKRLGLAKLMALLPY